jgi:hypothetical protein
MHFLGKFRAITIATFLLVVAEIFSPPLAIADTITPDSSTNPNLQQPAHYCPPASDLVKIGLFWYSKDKSWQCYTQSFAIDIKTFTGAQWEGVNVGKVFCFYIGSEQFAFPIALENVHSDIVLAPNGPAWSAKIGGGFKICKSANIVDCPFYYQPPPDLSHLYQEIEYTGGEHNDE